MPDKVTLEELEQLISQLTPKEQIKLIASISERLSKAKNFKVSEESWRKEYAARIKAFVKMSEEIAADTLGEVVSAKDIRQIREERTSEL